MDSLNVEQIGIGGILVLMCFKEFFSFLRFRGTEHPNEARKRVYLLLNQIDTRVAELHKWHEKEDEDGIKKWYVSTALRKVISSIDENLNTNNLVLNDLVRELRSMQKGRTKDGESDS